MTVSPHRPQEGSRRPTRRPSGAADNLFQSPASPPTLFQLQNLAPKPPERKQPEPPVEYSQDNEIATESVAAVDMSETGMPETDAPEAVAPEAVAPEGETSAARVNERLESMIASTRRSSPVRNVLATIAVIGISGFAISWVADKVEYIPSTERSSVATTTQTLTEPTGAAVPMGEFDLQLESDLQPTPNQITENSSFNIKSAESLNARANEPSQIDFPEIEMAPKSSMQLAQEADIPGVVVELTEPGIESVSAHDAGIETPTSLQKSESLQGTTSSVTESVSQPAATQLPKELNVVEPLTAPATITADVVTNDLDALAAQVEQFGAVEPGANLDPTSMKAQIPNQNAGSEMTRAEMTRAEMIQTSPTAPTEFGDQRVQIASQTNAQMISGPTSVPTQMASKPMNVTSKTPAAPAFDSLTPAAIQVDSVNSFNQTAPTTTVVAEPQQAVSDSQPSNVLSRTPNAIQDWSRYLPPAR